MSIAIKSAIPLLLTPSGVDVLVYRVYDSVHWMAQVADGDVRHSRNDVAVGMGYVVASKEELDWGF